MTDKTTSTVCIVGAGPVGLFTALLLGQAGIDVVVFEAEAAVSLSPRAIGYFEVTQREFRRAGILDDVRAAGLVNNTGQTWRKPRDGDILAHIPGGPDQSKWPIQLGQDKVGLIILKHLAKLPNVQVNFGHTLEDLEQRESEGTIVTRYSCRAERKKREHTSDFLVGADGGKSTVRRLTGIKLEGFTWTDFQVVASNIEYDLESFGWGPGNAVRGDDIWAIVAKIDAGKLWRCAYPVRTSELSPDEPWDEERERKRCYTKLAKLFPGPTDTARIDRLALYRIHQLCAHKFVQGRIALAGDSAHLTSPIGGLGLTTGLMDAALLSRAMKKIIVGKQPLSLLEGYGKERKDVFENVTNPAAIFHTHLVTGDREEDLARREEFFRAVDNRDFGFLRQLGEAYDKISSTKEDE